MADTDGTEDIVQNIVLAGQTEVILGLAAIAKAGNEAFEALRTGVSASGFGDAISAIKGITEALALSAAGVFAWTQAATNMVFSMSNLADQAGTTIEEMSSLNAAMAAMGANTDGLQAAFRRLAVRIQTEWPEIQKSVRDAAITIAEDQNRIIEAMQRQEGAALHLRQIRQQVALEEIAEAHRQQDFHNQAIEDANSVEQAEIAAIEARNRYNIAQGGPGAGLDRATLKDLEIRKAQADADEADQKVIEAQQKQRRDAQERAARADEDAIKRRQLAQEAAAAAEQQVTARIERQRAEEKLAEDRRNDIPTIAQYYKDLANGVQRGDADITKSTDNITKAIAYMVGASSEQFANLNKGFGNIAGDAPRIEPIILKVADLFHNMTSETEKNAVAVALFGRGFNQTLVEALSRGSTAILEEQQRLQSLGFVLTDLDKQVAINFRQSFSGFAAEVQIVGAQIGTVFGPTFTTVLDNLRKGLEDNRQKILDFATSIRDTVVPVIVGFGKAILGIDLSKNLNLSPDQIIKVGEWEKTFTSVKNLVVNVFESIKTFITSTLPPIVAQIRGFLDTVATQINRLFGTKYSGDQLGLLLLAGQISGVNNALVGLIGTLGAFGVAGLIAVNRIIGAISSLVGKWNELRGASETASKALVSAAENAAKNAEVAADRAERAIKEAQRAVDDASFKSDLASRPGATRAQKAQAASAAKTAKQAVSTAEDFTQVATDLGTQSEQLSSPTPTPEINPLNGLAALSAALDLNAGLGSGTDALMRRIVATDPELQKLFPEFSKSKSVPQSSPGPLQDLFSQLRDEDRAYSGLTPTTLTDQQKQDYTGQFGPRAAAFFTGQAPSQQEDQERRRAFVDLGESAKELITAAQALFSSANAIKSGSTQTTSPPPNQEGQGQGQGNQGSGVFVEGTPNQFAEGGIISGREGRDVIPALVSNREFVMRREATDHYGEGFMRAVNDLRLPKFALGGLVHSIEHYVSPRLGKMQLPGPVQHFADGGPVVGGWGGGSGGGGPTVHLHFGDRSFEARLRNNEEARSLERYVTERGYAQIGRRTNAFGG